MFQFENVKKASLKNEVIRIFYSIAILEIELYLVSNIIFYKHLPKNEVTGLAGKINVYDSDIFAKRSFLSSN